MKSISKCLYGRPAIMASVGAVAGLILAQASFGQEYTFESAVSFGAATGEITVGPGGVITAGDFDVLPGQGPAGASFSLVGDTFTLYPGGESEGFGGPLPTGYVTVVKNADRFGNGFGLGQELGADGFFFAQGGGDFYGGSADVEVSALPLEGNWMEVPEMSQTALLLFLSVTGLGVASKRFKSASA